MSKAKRGRLIAMDAAFSDLPDGAYLAAMEEYGFDADDLRHLPDSKPKGKEFRCQVCPRRFGSNGALQAHRRAKHPPIDLSTAHRLPSPSEAK